MTRLTQRIALLLLALWLPVTMHCALEVLPGFGFLSSCCGAHCTQHHDEDCAKDSCCSLESGFYKIEDNPSLAACFFPAFVTTLPEFAQTVQPPPARFIAVSASPPEMQSAWRFSTRTALPPRAPSA